MTEVISWPHLLFDICKASGCLQDFPKRSVLYETEHHGLIKEVAFNLPLARNSLSGLVQGHELLAKLKVIVQWVGRYFLTQS